MIPRAHWHHFIGSPILVHTPYRVYRGHLSGISSTHIFLHNGTPVTVSMSRQDALISQAGAQKEAYVDLFPVYFPGAAVAVPLTAIVGITAISLGAMW